MDEEDGLVLEHVVDRVFGGNADAKDAFVALAKEWELPHQIQASKSYLKKTFKTQRFKASNGIELKFPAALCEDPEQVQVISNPDGSCSILLKNLHPAE